MAKNTYAYRLIDRTGDEDAAILAGFAPHLSRDLADLGFTPVGLIEGRYVDPRVMENVRLFMAKEDADTMIQTVRQGEVVQVMAAPDQRAFAVVDRSIAGPLITMLTFFSNGDIVETLFKPTRAPRPVQGSGCGPLGWFVAMITRFGIGSPPIWPRRDRPGSGYSVELVNTQLAQTLYTRHQARVEQSNRQNGAVVPRHASLDLYRCAVLRSAQITKAQDGFALVIFMISLTVCFYFMILSARWFNPTQTELISCLSLWGTLIIFGAVIGLAQALAFRLIAPRIPVPHKSLDRLLLEQAQLKGGDILPGRKAQ